jgi:hypothetical protein
MGFINMSELTRLTNDSVKISKLFKNPAKDSLSIEKKFEILKQINESIHEDPLNVLLVENSKNIVNIEMSVKENSLISDSSLAGERIVIRGAVHDNGPIESFFLRYDLRNVIALLFQLPDKTVKVGDSWPLDVHLLSFDENFKCDTSRKLNKVTLSKIEKQGTETIAVLEYDIDEYVSGLFKSFLKGYIKTVTDIHYNAIAKFSIDKGRWISYEGTITTHSTGAMIANNIKKYSLIPQ